jgi:hypothetical protein
MPVLVKTDPAIGMKKDICGLQVAVDDAFGMGIIQGGGSLFKNGKSVAWRERASFLQYLM